MTEKIEKPKTSEQILEECLEYLDEVTYKFACFTDHFKTYLKKMGFKEEKE